MWPEKFKGRYSKRLKYYKEYQCKVENGLLSKEFKDWVNKSNCSVLTNNQHRFAEFLLDNKVKLMEIGDLKSVFISVYEYLKF